MTDTLRLSVLDLVPVRSGQTSAGAVAASVRLAQLADRLDFTRYWFAEHHNMPAVASTTPPVLIAATAARTERNVYDQAGRLAWRVDGTGAVTGFVHDAAGRVVQATQQLGSAGKSRG